MIEDSWDYGWQVAGSKKIFSEDGDDRKDLTTKKQGWEGELKNICGKYMKIGMEIQGKKLNGNKWEKMGKDKMDFSGQWMDELPYRKRSNFNAFWRFWHPPLRYNSEKQEFYRIVYLA